MDFKTRDTLISSLINSLESRLTIDLTEGTPERDIFVEAPTTGQLLDIWNALTYLYKLQAPFIYSNELLVGDLDVFCRNNAVNDIAATYSSGEVMFYTYTEPTKDIIITSSNSCATADGKNYTVSGYYTIPFTNRSNYYNATTRRWEITTNVIAGTAGTAGTTAALTINKINGSIVGIEGVTNTAAITGATDAGTIQDRLALVKKNFKGRNLATLIGIGLFVDNYSKKSAIIGSDSPLMLRMGGLGGGIDIYIRDEIMEGVVDTVTITSTGLNTLVDPQYTLTSIKFLYQPVHEIASVTKNGVILDNTYYELIQDSGLLSKSTESLDSLYLTSTGLAHLGEFKIGDIIVINYNYNILLHTIQNELNSSTNLYDNRSFLLREQSFFTVTVNASVKLYSGYTIANIISSASLKISDYIDGITNNVVELADIIGIIKNIAGVDNIDLSTAKLTASDGRTPTASGDLNISDNEYAKAGDILLIEWTTT
jgi:hypothetical protein